MNFDNPEEPFRDLSTSDQWPKTLLIRNTLDSDMIWQRYHVQKESEATKLANNAKGNGFYNRTLNDYDGAKETWPDWRETCSPDILQ